MKEGYMLQTMRLHIASTHILLSRIQIYSNPNSKKCWEICSEEKIFFVNALQSLPKCLRLGLNVDSLTPEPILRVLLNLLDQECATSI